MFSPQEMPLAYLAQQAHGRHHDGDPLGRVSAQAKTSNNEARSKASRPECKYRRFSNSNGSQSIHTGASSVPVRLFRDQRRAIHPRSINALYE